MQFRKDKEIKQNILQIIIGVVLLIFSVFLFKILNKKESQKKVGDTFVETGKLKSFFSISGQEISEEQSKQRPLAVVVENHPDSRPQSGLSKADIVYETLAEGGITRFLAVFQSNNINQIGSVRSAREYFAEIANEWGALFAHVGGSNEVISQLKKGKYKNLADANEYFNFDFFPRRNDKPEPHHIFTSTQKLRELIEYQKFSNQAVFSSWQFKNEAPATTSLISKIQIDFSREGYEVGWEYDSLKNAYKRLQYFEPHIDELSKAQITAKNVVVQFVEVMPVLNDPLLQVDIDLFSGGKALVFLDGKVIEGVWKKSEDKTRFYDLFGKEIEFNRGNIWLELVPKDRETKVLWK